MGGGDGEGASDIVRFIIRLEIHDSQVQMLFVCLSLTIHINSKGFL